MDAALVGLLEDTAKELAFPYRRMMSGAGHDSMHWADYAPTAMIFIPCRAGISHNPAEHAELADIVRGTELLSAAVRKLASEYVGRADKPTVRPHEADHTQDTTTIPDCLMLLVTNPISRDWIYVRKII